MFEILIRDSILALPFLGWIALALIVLCFQILWSNSWLSLTTAIVGLLALIGLSVLNFDPGLSREIFSGAAVVDYLSQTFNLMALVSVLALILLMIPGFNSPVKNVKSSYEQLPEFLICLILSGFGVSVLGAARDLSSLFLGLEILSIGVYCLCGFYRTEIRSTESAFKYLLIGAFSTVIFLYGIAFIYGATGSTQYVEIAEKIGKGAPILVLMGSVFIVAGIAFKMALVPFHLYTPDVYEGAPTPVTSYIASVVKIGAAAAGLRVFWEVLGPVFHYWQPFWVGLCVLSILVGNLGALQQKTIKKLLAFSSISHGGFIGLGMVVAQAQQGGLFPLLCYLVVYTAMTFGVFSLLTYMENREEIFLVEDLKGLGQRKVLWGLLFGIFILSLAGLPPFAGFMIKFWVLQALLAQGFIVVSILAIVGSVIGAAYYLRILMLLFMVEPEGRAIRWGNAPKNFYSTWILLFFATAITLLGGLRPSIYADWILTALALK